MTKVEVSVLNVYINIEIKMFLAVNLDYQIIITFMFKIKC